MTLKSQGVAGVGGLDLKNLPKHLSFILSCFIYVLYLVWLAGKQEGVWMKELRGVHWNRDRK